MIQFLAGLPRSGSTVLGAILNQNPAIHCTSTSPMLDVLIANRQAYDSMPYEKNSDQIDNVTRGIIDSFWCHIDKPLILDKNRGWAKNMPAANILFKRPMKMIACVRDIPSIMASWLTLIRKNPGTALDQMLIQNGLHPTDENRMAEMWDNMVRDCVEGINQALKDVPEQVFLVEYDNLVRQPENVLAGIEEFLDIPHHQYDLDNIVSLTNDDDLTAWGLSGMHTIKPKLSKTNQTPQEILGDELFMKYNFPWKQV